MRLFRRFLLPLLLVGALAGCRTYGSYGNVEAHRDQIRVAAQAFEASLARNQADYRLLAGRAAANPALAGPTERMAALVAEQETALAEIRETLDGLDDEDDYRWLNRTYGALITRQQMVNDRYADVVRGVVRDTTERSYLESAISASRFSVVPPQYYRVNNQMQAPSLGAAVALPVPPAPADTTARVAR